MSRFILSLATILFVAEVTLARPQNVLYAPWISSAYKIPSGHAYFNFTNPQNVQAAKYDTTTLKEDNISLRLKEVEPDLKLLYKNNNEDIQSYVDEELRSIAMKENRHPIYIKSSDEARSERFFYPVKDEVTTTKQLLIFRPEAHSTAESNGTAVANPISRAIVKKGSKFEIIFDPKAVAIAGPGGTAHAESDLIIDYYEWTPPAQLLSLPYYGGAKGQVLQIATDPSGTTLAQRIVPSNGIDLQQPIEDQNQIQDTSYSQMFASSLRNIQASAQRLVELQKKTSKTGQLKADDQKVYATHLALLGEAASNLAQLGTRGEYDLSQLFVSKNEIDNKKTNDKQDFDDGEENVGEEHESDSSNVGVDEDDSIHINSDSASVAEAKPVGVAIVGDGGVASSKPVATAVVGPGGLAIARPVATAIAGVDPSTVGFGTKIPISAKTPIANRAQMASMQQYHPVQQYLTNPQYFIPQMHQLYPIELAIQ